MADKNKKDLKRKRKKKKSKGKNTSPLYRLMNSDLPLHGCWINQDWQSVGNACILVTRKLPTGLIIFCGFTINIVQQKIEECFGHSHITEDQFRRDFFEETKIVFMNVELDLIKEVLAEVVWKAQQREEELTEVATLYLRLIGPLEDQLARLQEKEKPEEEQSFYKTIAYKVNNAEDAETELIQMDELEETHDSIPGERKFSWSIAERRGFFGSKGNKKEVARLLLEEKELQLQIIDEWKTDYCEQKLLQYLGTVIDEK